MVTSSVPEGLVLGSEAGIDKFGESRGKGLSAVKDLDNNLPLKPLKHVDGVCEMGS